MMVIFQWNAYWSIWHLPFSHLHSSHDPCLRHYSLPLWCRTPFLCPSVPSSQPHHITMRPSIYLITFPIPPWMRFDWLQKWILSRLDQGNVCMYVCVHVCALLLHMLVSKLNCLYLLQKKKWEREDGEGWGVGVKINLLDQKIFNFAAHQTNFVFRQGVLRRACLFLLLPLLFLHLVLLFSLIKKAFYYYSRWKGNIYSNSTVVPDYH